MLVLTVVRPRGKNQRFTAFNPLGRDILIAIAQIHVQSAR